MLTLVMSEYPDDEPGIMLVDMPETVGDEATAEKLIKQAFSKFVQEQSSDDWDVAEIADAIDSDCLETFGIRRLEDSFMVVRLDAYAHPTTEWAQQTTQDTCEETEEAHQAEQETPVEVDENGLNKKIGFVLLDDDAMLDAGFRNPKTADDLWYFFKNVAEETTINVTIYKDGRRGRIDVLDEQFCQPYDYQHILEENPHHPFATKVRDNVEAIMADLAERGIITGHVRGEYI